MKKMFSFLLAVAMVFTLLPFSAFADEVSAGTPTTFASPFPYQGYKTLENCYVVKPTGSARSYTELSFSGLQKNYTALSDIRYTVPDGGSMTLTVHDCVWNPGTYKIKIGFFNNYGGTDYYFTSSSGSVRNKTFTQTNMPGGEYWVYVENKASFTITSGTMHYSVS